MTSILNIICKPEQSGKTFTMLNIITYYKLVCKMKYKKCLNILFTANNLLLTEQTYNRFDTCFNTDKTIKYSSTAKYRKFNDLWTSITLNDIDNVICCTNNTRISDIVRLINGINEKFREYEIFIWIDEIHSFYKQTKIFLDLNLSNVKVYGLTATPKKEMFKIYNQIDFYPIENVTLDNYHGWNSNKIIEYDFIGKNIDFIDLILKNNTELIIPGTKWFIPANFKIKDHNETKNLLQGYGFTVIIVNSNGITLTFPNKKQIRFDKNNLFEIQIVEIYKEYNLNEFTVALTGHNCIGEAITIQSEEFLLDYAILYQTDNEEKNSQLAGRTKGNIKNYKNYKPCTVFTTANFNENAKRKEQLTYKLNEIALENNKTVKLEQYNLFNKKYKSKDVRGRVPIIIPSDNDTISQMDLKNKTEKINILKSIINNFKEHSKLYAFINNNSVFCDQITKPTSENSYKKHITDLINANLRNEPFYIDIKESNKNKNHWNCYIDYKNNQFCIIVWSINKCLY